MRDVVLLVDRDGSGALLVYPKFDTGTRNVAVSTFHYFYIEYALSQTMDGIILYIV